MHQSDEDPKSFIADDIINNINEQSVKKMASLDNVCIEDFFDKSAEHATEESIKKTLKKYTQYENNKLVNLQEYPPFIDDIYEIRQQCNILDNGNHVEYINEHEKMLMLNNEYYAQIANIFNAFRSILFGNEDNYKMVTYYVIFNTMLPDKYFSYFSPELCYGTTKENYIEKCKNNLLILEKEKEFHYLVDVTRKLVGIVENDSAENISFNYIRFYQYIDRFEIYKQRNSEILKAIFNILSRYEFLDVNSELDYLLIYYYLYSDKELPEDFYNEHLNGLKIKFTSNILGSIFDYKRSPLYIEIPSFANSEYLELMIPSIINESIKHYNITIHKAFWNLSSSFKYYRNKFVYDFIEKHDTEKKFKSLRLSERAKYAEKIIRNHFNQEYKVKYYPDDYFILDDKEFTDAAINDVRKYEHILKTKKIR